ncbi:DUF2378 family protein [Myxococcaceae bacterium GXIMD 01537]
MRDRGTGQATPRIPASVMEGMFVRGLHAEGKLAEGLLSLGYDIRKPELDYPVIVWQRCVNLARQELFAHLGDEEAYRLLGRKLVLGFMETLVGRMMAVALPMIGPARVIDRLPRYLAMMGRGETAVTITSVNERARRVHLADRYNRPEFLAGCLEVALEHANARPLVTVEERGIDGYRLFLRW